MIRPPRTLALIAACVIALSGCAWLFPNEPRFVDIADTPRVPGANAPGVVYGGMLYTAGFTPRDPHTGAVAQGDIAAQTNRVLDNLEVALKGAGCTLGDVVRVDVFLADVNDAARMNEVMAARFGDHKPARGAVSLARLPRLELLEADFIARLPK